MHLYNLKSKESISILNEKPFKLMPFTVKQTESI